MADDTEITGCATNTLAQDESLVNKDGSGSTPSTSHSQGETSNRTSPDLSCSICLGKLQNKSFTDSCFHTFCFACLLKWSKVKAVCPLCKVKFKSIVHNVRSDDDYDQYYVAQTPSAHSTWSTSDDMGFRYSTNMSIRQSDFPVSIRFFQCEEHRRTYAPHSFRLNPGCPVNRQQSPSEVPRIIHFRRWIYAESLWAIQTSRERRSASPRLYYENQTSTQRLVPWLTRELIVLLGGSDQRVGFILDLIMSLILRHNIMSGFFFLHIKPYFGAHTNHFIHEFHNYAISIYDMDRYDELVQYVTFNQFLLINPGEHDVITIESDDDMEQSPVNISTRPGMLSSSSSHFPMDFSQPSSSMTCAEPSTSRVGSMRPLPNSTPPIVTIFSESEEDDDECIFLQELKTPDVFELTDSEREGTPTLPRLEPVYDGTVQEETVASYSTETVTSYSTETFTSLSDNSSSTVIEAPDNSQIPVQDESPYMQCNLSCTERLHKRRVARKAKQQDRNPLQSSRTGLGRLSSFQSKDKNSRSWSRKQNISHDQGLPTSESLEFGESSHSVQMPGTNALSGRGNPNVKKLKIHNFVKKSTRRNSSKSSVSNKKHKRKRKKAQKPKPRKH